MSFEVPGFHVPGAPVFNGAAATSMGAGEFPDAYAVLDLGMVFGSRLWGHDLELGVGPTSAPGLGDLYTHELREAACRALCERVADELREDADAWRALVLHTGSEAVETALKTALRATGRDRMVAFTEGYHGTFGLALAVTHRPDFWKPWAAQLPGTVRWMDWGAVGPLDGDVACVVVEPWQGRAGVVPPPDGFLPLLREECDRVGALLVFDAVLCGAGRTGPVLAEALTTARPDILCLGKALGAGVVASAVVMRREVADAAWEHGPVEPAHTSTSIGDPLACAGILRSLELLTACEPELREACVAWAGCMARLGEATGLEHRGLGLLWALDTGRVGGGVKLAGALLDDHRVVVVPSGPDGASITIYPPAIGTPLERERFVAAVEASLAQAMPPSPGTNISEAP